MKNIIYIKYHYKNIQNRIINIIILKKYFGLKLSLSVSWNNSYLLPKYRWNNNGIQLNFMK